MKSAYRNRRRQHFIANKKSESNLFGHWELAKNICKSQSSQAFTYLLWFPTIQMFYIGVKKLYHPDGTEYDWKTYQSSSKHVKELINDGHQVEYLITNWFDSYSDAVSAETSEQYKVSAHTNQWCLNKSISGNKFFTPGPHSINTKKKMSAASIGKRKSKEHCMNMSKSRVGVPKSTRSNEHCNNLSKARMGTKNPRWNGYVNTPDGTFNTTITAADHFKVHRETIRRRCESKQSKWADWYFSKHNTQGGVI